jgi:predicted DCC family thiol-disulfide oxidoreductase YuxK
MRNMYNPYQWQKIIFFDGVCVLCNRAVDFLLKNDHKKRLKFATLQSVNAVAFIQQLQNQPVKDGTIIFYDEGRFLIKSTAVLKIARYLGLPYSVFALVLIIPRPWRDAIYDIIARNRAKWFGTRGHCRVPDQETSGRIID